jgi:hypothetical protein
VISAAVLAAVAGLGRRLLRGTERWGAVKLPRETSQISITMDVYTHVVQDTQREAMSHMDRLLGRRPGRE